MSVYAVADEQYLVVPGQEDVQSKSEIVLMPIDPDGAIQRLHRLSLASFDR